MPNLLNVLRMNSLSKVIKPLFVIVSMILTRRGTIWRCFAANQCDGIISSSHNLGIEDYEKVEAPIVAFDRNLAPKIPIVSSDNFEGGKLAARAMVKAGCQRIVMITGYDNSDSPTGTSSTRF